MPIIIANNKMRKLIKCDICEEYKLKKNVCEDYYAEGKNACKECLLSERDENGEIKNKMCCYCGEMHYKSALYDVKIYNSNGYFCKWCLCDYDKDIRKICPHYKNNKNKK